INNSVEIFRTALSPHDYVKVRTVRLVGILLNVFCLRKHLNYLRNMESAITRTGLMGLWGNKGAISLRLEIYGVNLCVVNAHFAAHDHQNKQRINDYNTVIREQSFTVDKESTRILYHE
ncbi:inositol polyphosphate 5-phosphatase K-like, partial [Diaphorina citri]|uniref:Inositol polyphosphate 5-phosphatase K-like n=1 Tax=Diaphorina citri TaxID=121845 RepID=A0A3Q0J2A0_DIACI